MLNFIKFLFNRAVQAIFSAFDWFFTSHNEWSEAQKISCISTIIHGQLPSLQMGFALRHVDSQAVFNANVRDGFQGDAVSYAITPYIMSLALNENVEKCSFHIDKASGRVSYMINDDIKPRELDTPLAVCIFDILHERILQFVRQNFYGNPHYFMLLKDMHGATSPYDIKDIYPTGKCGKRKVEAKQIISSVSKSHSLNSPEAVVRRIEETILNINQPAPAKHLYDAGSTKAIISILKEIELKPGEGALTSNAVRNRLTNAECDKNWTDAKYKNFYETGGYVKIFEQNLSKINDDLDYFRNQL